MGRRIVLIAISCWLLAIGCIAQSDSAIVRKGLLRAGGTFAFGTMPQYSISNAYLTGNLEYSPEARISVRGDVYYFLNSLTNNSPLLKNDALYFGAVYHFLTHSHFDPIIGIQPGISYTQMSVNALTIPPTVVDDTPDASPLFSTVAGFNFYAEKWFHIQLNVRYTVGEHLTEIDESNISELSFNFGLGFNLNVLSKQ